jgi:hypothetical protein
MYIHHLHPIWSTAARVLITGGKASATSASSVPPQRRFAYPGVDVCVCVCVRNGHRVLLSRLPLGMYKMQENRRHPRHTVVVVVTDPLSIGIIPEIFI